jgi:fructose-bisphosphate aldolase/2-amino-3,7-dideoxy-D-threo-hept-6-ulosonate synthase
MILSQGKRIRMSRLINAATNSCIICALDHGLTSPVFLDGLYATRERAREAIAGGAHVLMLSQGFSQRVLEEFEPNTALALMLTASAACRVGGSVITGIGSVENALHLGADAVVVYCALATEREDRMLTYLSEVGQACASLGMPLIAEAEWPNAYEGLEQISVDLGPDYLKRNARICAELGADIVKVNWSGDPTSFGEIIKACASPVVVAGGTLVPDQELLTRFQLARDVGACGCSVGRNIFQHLNPEAMTKAIARVFRDKWTAQAAYSELVASMSASKSPTEGSA